ncbi:hypothetical protein DFH05DRAFT_1393100, partial [Lentinula detonsa]
FTLILVLACISTLIDVISRRTRPTPFGTQHVALLLTAWGPVVVFGDDFVQNLTFHFAHILLLNSQDLYPLLSEISCSGSERFRIHDILNQVECARHIVVIDMLVALVSLPPSNFWAYTSYNFSGIQLYRYSNCDLCSSEYIVYTGKRRHAS